MNNIMRILYVLRSVDHFSYHESVIRHLCNSGHDVQVLFGKSWSKNSIQTARQTFLSERGKVVFDWLIPRNDLWRWPLFTSRELLSYTSYLNRKDQSDYYLKRWESYLSLPIRLAVWSAWVKRFLAREFIQEKLRTIEHMVPPDGAITRWLVYNRPDAVVASPLNMRFSEEVEYVKAAKALGIYTVVPIMSWDNLTTKGLFHIIPDLTLVWNEAQFDEATKIHRIPPDKIVITGAPFFDKWFESDRLGMERELFCRKVGLDPENPFLVYLGSSANIAIDETWLVRELLLYLRRHQNSDIRRMSILIRPHPANAQIYKQIDERQVTVWPKDGTLPDSEDSLKEFYNTLRYCLGVVGINTSGMIDAIIADKPCVTIMTERYRATQFQAIHFQYLLDADVLEITKSAEECADRIEILHRGKDSTRKARSRFVQRFIRPRGLDIPAGKITAQAIEMGAVGKSAEKINSDILCTEALKDD